MANRLGKLPILVYTPAVPAVPGRAAYCVSVPKYGNASGLSTSGSRSGSYAPSGQIPAGWDGVQDPNGYGTSYSPIRPVSHYTTECYPAIASKAGIPARVDSQDNISWNAGARTINPVPEVGFFRATLPPAPLGVQLGFSRRQFDHTYSSMSHSVVVRLTSMTIVERGLVVYGPESIAAEATIEVRRVNGVVSYVVNDEVVYTSTEIITGELYGAAMLYSTADYVDSPVLGSLGAAADMLLELPAIVSAISTEEGYTSVDVSLPGMTVLAEGKVITGIVNAEFELPNLVAAIATVESGYSFALLALPQPSFRASGGLLEVLPNNVIALLPKPIVSIVGIAGVSIEFSAVLPLDFVAGTQSYNRVQKDLELRLVAAIGQPYLPADESDGSDAAYVDEFSVIEAAMILIAIDELGVASSQGSLTIVLELATIEALMYADNADFGSLIELITQEGIAVVSRTAAARQQALQYAVNYLSGALSTYENFDFDGFANTGHATYAWKSDGLYRIRPGDDNGNPITSLVNFGVSDFSDSHLKRLTDAFVGVRTDGECYIRVVTDQGTEQVYALSGFTNEKRATLASGVASRFWDVTLELVDASYATLDSVEYQIGVSQRRSNNRGGRSWPA